MDHPQLPFLDPRAHDGPLIFAKKMQELTSLLVTLQVTRDIVACMFSTAACDIHLNHGGLLDAIWSWTGVKDEHRLKVAEVCFLNI